MVPFGSSYELPSTPNLHFRNWSEGIAKGKKILIMWTHQIRNQQITNFLVGLRRVRGFCKKLLIHKITNRFSDEKKNNSTYYCSRVLVGQLLGGENCSFPAVQGFKSEDGRGAVENFVSKELAPLVPKFQQTTLKSDNAFSKKNALKIVPFFLQLQDKLLEIGIASRTVAPISKVGTRRFITFNNTIVKLQFAKGVYQEDEDKPLQGFVDKNLHLRYFFFFITPHPLLGGTTIQQHNTQQHTTKKHDLKFNFLQLEKFYSTPTKTKTGKCLLLNRTREKSGAKDLRAICFRAN